MLLGNELRRLTERCPHREAVVFEGRRWSYLQLNAEVNRAAHAFAALGVGRGDRIGLSLATGRSCSPPISLPRSSAPSRCC